jgi:hypothetical protein
MLIRNAYSIMDEVFLFQGNCPKISSQVFILRLQYAPLSTFLFYSCEPVIIAVLTWEKNLTFRLRLVCGMTIMLEK